MREEEEKKNAHIQQRDTIHNANSSRHKKNTYKHIYHAFKEAKSKKKYLAQPRLRWYLHSQLLMRPNVTYLPCSDGNGSIPRRMSARCQSGYKIKNINFFSFRVSTAKSSFWGEKYKYSQPAQRSQASRIKNISFCYNQHREVKLLRPKIASFHCSSTPHVEFYGQKEQVCQHKQHCKLFVQNAAI